MSGSTAHRLWLPEEDRVVERFARGLAAGRFRFQREAAAACLVALSRLYANLRRSDPGNAVASRGRSPDVVKARLRELMRRQGLAWGWFGLSAAEDAAVRRHARGLVSGRFPDALRAAEACLREVLSLPPDSKPVRPRTLATIHLHILDEAHRLRRSWPRARWLSEEDGIIARHARALARGAYPGSAIAVSRCRRDLASLNRPRAGGYRERNLRPRLIKLAHEAGWVSRLAPLSREAQRVLDDYTRRLFRGEYRTGPAAAADCARAMRRRGITERFGNPASPAAVRRELLRQVQRLKLPRLRADWRPEELRIIEAYARRVGTGEFQSWYKAATACRAELQQFWTRAVRSSRVNVRRPAGRGVPAIHGRMLELAHDLKLPGPGRRRWTPREDKAVAAWLRWYDRYRVGRKRGPLGTAASGLQEDIEALGLRRTLVACRTRLKIAWLELHGLA